MQKVPIFVYATWIISSLVFIVYSTWNRNGKCTLNSLFNMKHIRNCGKWLRSGENWCIEFACCNLFGWKREVLLQLGNSSKLLIDCWHSQWLHSIFHLSSECVLGHGILCWKSVRNCSCIRNEYNDWRWWQRQRQRRRQWWRVFSQVCDLVFGKHETISKYTSIRALIWISHIWRTRTRVLHCRLMAMVFAQHIVHNLFEIHLKRCMKTRIRKLKRSKVHVEISRYIFKLYVRIALIYI